MPYLPLKQVSSDAVLAVLTVEDDRFTNHGGLDSLQIQTSLADWIKRGKRLRGASTITQQLAKIAFLNPQRSFSRKLIETVVTWRLERHLSKAEILGYYLANAAFGKRLYGLRAAAHFYFRRRPARLTLPQSLLLAALLASPERYSRGLFKGVLTRRMRTVLERSAERIILVIFHPLYGKLAVNGSTVIQTLEHQSLRDLRGQVMLAAEVSRTRAYWFFKWQRAGLYVRRKVRAELRHLSRRHNRHSLSTKSPGAYGEGA